MNSAVLGFGGVICLIFGALCMLASQPMAGTIVLAIGMLCFASKKRDPVDAMQGVFMVLIVLGILAKLVTTFSNY